MDKITSFSYDVQKQLKYYVYRLIDPRNGRTFYVGKGKGNRVFAHIKAALKEIEENKIETESNSYKEDEISLKIKTINDIHNAGLEVIHIIQRWGIETEKEAFLVESAVIDCFSDLSNIQDGHDSYHGVTNAYSLENLLKTEEYIEPQNIDYIIIKIKQAYLDERGTIYETTRRAWILNLERAKKYKYVLAVMDGIVQEVFEVKSWYNSEEPRRIEFEGIVANDDIRNIFYHKRIPEKYCVKGMASPALYSKKI